MIILQDNKKKRSEKIHVDWEHDSDLEDSDDDMKQNEESSEEEDLETGEEKRVRMAKELLAKVGAGDEESEDDESSDEEEDTLGRRPATKLDSVSQKLHEELLRSKGRLRKPVADTFKSDSLVHQFCPRAHRLAVTCLALSESEDFAFTGSKDCSIVRWDVETGKKLAKYPGQPATKSISADKIKGHHDEVLSMSLSSDGRYLASGGRDKVVRIWDVRTDSEIDAFQGHQGAVSGLAFQLGKHMLYSGSNDRTIRAWNIDEMAYVESLFGHQAEINAIDCLYRERAVSCSVDRTVRFWKIPEESQLVLQGVNKASLDCIKMVDEVHFVTGSQDGFLSLWHTMKKKPCSVVRNAHDGTWISAIAALRNSDMIATGGSDGFVRFWKVDLGKRDISVPCVGKVAVPGFVNALGVGISGRVVVAGSGQEHRLGRWGRDPKGRNGLHIFRLPESDDADDVEEHFHDEEEEG
uniref:Uncharacterized protein n=1 Tax=Mucochytrium quahogii TaxID=96639 RepID=A0A7S2WJG3_9STRA|mmetsp:Transcript_9128/g.17213  ORF Transcript_9128/g.17213 Transcript_9128/m.17213 type:complete len:466 (+) Transcript_9128:424-1821(+)